MTVPSATTTDTHTDDADADAAQPGPDSPARADRAAATGLHTLHVRADPTTGSTGRSYSITCPHDPADTNRSCVAWWPCAEHGDDVVFAGLDDAGEGPCDEADPALFGGRHQYFYDDVVCHPTRLCILAISDRLHDEADDLQLAPGDYPVDWIPEEDGALNLALNPGTTGSTR